MKTSLLIIRNQVFRPFNYLKIEGHDAKARLDWIIPAAASICILLATLPFHDKINFFGDNGLIDRLLSFISIFPGFYIASLAAIATFNNESIDTQLEAPQLKAKLKINAKYVDVILTRRLFLCMLFSYLTAVSIIFCSASILALALAPAVKSILQGNFLLFASFTVFSAFIFAFIQLMTTTFFGLYYLGDRIHR